MRFPFQLKPKVFPPSPSGNNKKKDAHGQGAADKYGIQITE